jgi:hypothetical protein
MLLHDNARPLAAARTQAKLQEFGWEVFEHPAYSPDLSQVISLVTKIEGIFGRQTLQKR